MRKYISKTNCKNYIYLSDLIMDVIMFVAVDMRVSVVMVGLVGVGGFMFAGVTEKYFTK